MKRTHGAQVIAQALQTAIAHHQRGDLVSARALYQQILAQEPQNPDALHLLGLIEHQQGNSQAGLRAIQQAIELRPDDATFHFNLANMQQELGQYDQAIASYQRVLVLQPDSVEALNYLAIAWRLAGDMEQAEQTFRRALDLGGDRQAEIHSNLLFTLLHDSRKSAAEVFAEHQQYAQWVETPLKPLWQPHTNSRDTQRRLKIAYVSGDFCAHVVAYFIEPILAQHDKSAFEVFAYYSYHLHDAHTRAIANSVDHWRECFGVTDEGVAQCIRDDGIDILIDLSGHTVYNRLPVFARKPAPVQVNWVGYPGSTGLTCIDYCISDPWQDAPGVTERYHSEALVRLPSGMAFEPDPASPPANPLPALQGERLTLACLNNLSKVNPAVIALWSRILHALPQARLMLGNAGEDSVRARLLGLFAQHQIGPERLVLQPRVPMADYLALHHQIDLALDPFPYNGGTTTMHSLWMGVPVVSLTGDHAVSRLSAAHLSRVGLNEFISHSEDDYLQCVLTFANDLPRLSQVRQSLRQRMNASECSPANITRHVEAAYREMWRKWCGTAACKGSLACVKR